MVYPDSPFTDKFNNSTITYLNNKNNAKISEENISDILKWICETPNVSSFRVNTKKSNIKSMKKLLTQVIREVAEIQSKAHCVPNVSIHPVLSDVIIVNSYPKHELDLKLCDKEIIVDGACGSAVLRGAHVFAPGVMAMQTGTKVNDRVSVYADTMKTCKKGFQKIFDSPGKIFVGNGIVKMIRSELFGEDLIPTGIAVQITDSLSGCPSVHENYLPGLVMLQNIPSIVCGHVLNPKPGDVVLDMCAAPGNKTSHLADLMENKGILIAVDKTPNKYKQLQQKCVDFSLSCVSAFMFDSTKLCGENLLETTCLRNGPPFPPNSFDKILLDGPCSGLGNRPQLVNTITDKVARSYVALQRNLFKNAVLLLKPGGHLVYSTCTITLGENEGMVAWALETFDSLELTAAEPLLGSPGWPGTSLTPDQLNLIQRFGPNQSDSIGFFIAHFIKK